MLFDTYSEFAVKHGDHQRAAENYPEISPVQGHDLAAMLPPPF